MAADDTKDQLAKVISKLETARAELKTASSEVNSLRTRVAELESVSPVESLKAENEKLAADLSHATELVSSLTSERDKALRDVGQAQPALALVAALKGV